jgi:uncharacterized protein (DUF2164 family)
MGIKLSDEKQSALLLALTRLYHSEFDEDLSEFQAQRVLEFALQHLGPALYNQGIQDARTFMGEKLDDLDAEFYEPEIPL